MEVTAQTTGFKELERAFKILPDRVANQVLSAGVLAGARVLERAAKASAPRGGNERRSVNSFIYGRLQFNIKGRNLRKRRENSRAAIVTAGKSFWGKFLNRGTRYIPASRWYDMAIESHTAEALSVIKLQMVKKLKQVANKAIRDSGAAKR